MKNGWEEFARNNHGIALKKEFPNGEIRVTTIKDTSDSIPIGTLKAILSNKQTGLGRKGFLNLLNKKK